jgi:alpha-L-fucosidase
MKGIILTTKHHDGFCLWPAEGTEHSVKNSPWRNGKGNLLSELREACDEYGLKLGFYLSPWDRNHAEYGKPEYLDYYRNQLKDILTNYGEIFEVWFDGANGGDGYYGGANENRIIDKKAYYDWENTHKLVLELQPDAVIFSDKGPGTRWIGNERGYAGETNWSLLNPDRIIIGGAGDKLQLLNEGDENGTVWIPGETDVSIRPGWFYHESHDGQVKTTEQLLDIYYASVGRNSNMLLNIPIDKRGLVHENDSAALMNLKAMLDSTFAKNLASGAKAEASNFRGNHKKYKPSNTIDLDKENYWATDDGIIQSSLTLDFGKPEQFNLFMVQEYIQLGQRVKSFQIEAYIDDTWEPIAEATTIGYKRILRFPMVESQKLRFTILDAKACPVISNIGVYKAPEQISNPEQ